MEGRKTLAEKRNAVVLRGLKKYFPGTKALDWGADDAIEIKEGEIHGLVGENGRRQINDLSDPDGDI